MAGTLAGWPGQVVRVRAVSRAGEPSRAQVTLGAGRPEMGGSVREDRNIINSSMWPVDGSSTHLT